MIVTTRLQLRQWRNTDLSKFAALNADPQVMEFMPATLSRWESDALAAGIRNRIASYGWGLWAVEILGGAPFIGFVGLTHPEFEAHFTPCTEVGWRLAREHWGKGYATEAALAACDFAFTPTEAFRNRFVHERGQRPFTSGYGAPGHEARSR